MNRDIQDRRALLTAPSVLVLACLTLASGPSWSLGLGRPQTLSNLGQPLHLLFPVQLADGETLTPDCLRGEVYSGDNLLPAQQLRWQLESDGQRVRAVRLRTLQAIDEPLVSVQLSVGCPARLTRQFTAFMDPPGHNADTTVAVAAPVEVPQVGTSAAFQAANPASSAVVRPARPASRPQNMAPDRAMAAASAASAPATPPKRRQARRPASTESTAVAPRAGGPRLSLEPMEPMPSPAQLAAEAAAASAASAAAQAQTQLQAMERRVAEMQEEQRRTLAALQALRTELEATRRDNAQGPSGWLLGLGVLCAALAASSLLLWRSNRVRQRDAQQSWWSESKQDAGGPGSGGGPVAAPGGVTTTAAAPARTVAAPAVVTMPAPLAAAASSDAATRAPSSNVVPTTVPMPLSSDTPTAPAALGAGASSHRPSAPSPRPISPPTSAADDALEALAHLDSLEAVGLQLSPHDETRPMPLSMELAGGGTVTVEELIDLEQQVDFFMVLGQDDAAIELLSSRVDDRAANSGLPYLKLMELYQRRGDRQAFDRIASTFSQQFRARAPAWSDDLNEGQGLDVHPQLLDRLQAGWSDPEGSMSLLQDLLSKHQEYSGDLGLPAYRDLLLLYAVARDRAEHEAVTSGAIDLLLPLDETASPAMMATMAWQAPPPAPGAPPPSGSGDSGWIDLDLSLVDDAKDRKDPKSGG